MAKETSGEKVTRSLAERNNAETVLRRANKATTPKYAPGLSPCLFSFVLFALGLTIRGQPAHQFGRRCIEVQRTMRQEEEDGSMESDLDNQDNGRGECQATLPRQRVSRENASSIAGGQQKQEHKEKERAERDRTEG